MYCKFCGKELVDGARFCGFCGKNQERTTTAVRKIDPFTLFCTISTWVIQVAIIILSFFAICNVKIGREFLSTEFSLNFMDLFNAADIFTKYFSFSNTTNSISGNLIGFGIFVVIAIGICILYFLFNILTYSFKKQDQFVSIIGKNYNNYSVIPDFFLITVTTIGIIILHTLLGEYGSASPAAPLIIIYVLTAIQSFINITYKCN